MIFLFYRVVWLRICPPFMVDYLTVTTGRVLLSAGLPYQANGDKSAVLYSVSRSHRRNAI